MTDAPAWFATTARAVESLRPDIPLHCLRPAVAAGQARRIAALFGGKVLYAAKANPDGLILDAVWRAGIQGFDAASIGEVATLRARFATAEIAFMNPIKPRAAISAAYRDYGVRSFALDRPAELAKILTETDTARDLTLIVRIAVHDPSAMWPMSTKFGALAEGAVALVQAARQVAARVGIAFHVGSLCLRPDAYRTALLAAGAIARAAGVAPDIIDIGGGFPIAYDGITPPPIEAYAAAVHAALDAVPLSGDGEVWCEPGRAIAGPAGSLVVQVTARDGGRLYINDGIYGGLAAPGPPPPAFGLPLRRIGVNGSHQRQFRVFGPTCDGSDELSGLVELPADMAEGDWIEIGQHGAYGACLRSDFNGLHQSRTVAVGGPPMLHTPGYQDHEYHDHHNAAGRQLPQ